MMALEGGSFGFQIGGQATDFVLLVLNEGGARGILAGKVKLGGDASIAAGPVGRDASAETDVTLRSEILSYSRSRGLFAGISLEGSTIRPDKKANEQLYGRDLEADEIVLSDQVRVPAAAEQLVSTLEAKTPRHKTLNIRQRSYKAPQSRSSSCNPGWRRGSSTFTDCGVVKSPDNRQRTVN
jgi:lipid-binding SYLF domain-containing protein